MDQPWECSACTFINEKGGAKCEMCESARPALPSPMKVDEKPPSTTEPKKDAMQIDPTPAEGEKKPVSSVQLSEGTWKLHLNTAT